MKAKKEMSTQTRRGKASSPPSTNGHLTPKKPKVKKKLEEKTADELLLEAWKRLYAKRDKFISMWD